MQTVEIRLNRVDGVKVTRITFNGNIQTVGQSVSQPKPERRFLHELTEEERAERMKNLRERLIG